MATSNLVQYLEGTGVSVSGASVNLGTTPSDRKQEETFLCETAITAGQVLAVDVTKMATDTSGGLTSLFVLPADYNSATVQKIVVGVAAQTVTGTATSPQPVKVIIRGPALSVPAVGAIAQGDPVILDPAGAAGSCAAQLPYNSASANLVSEAFGFAMSAAAAGVVSVYVLGKGI